MGGVVKTLQRGTSLSRSVFSTAGLWVARVERAPTPTVSVLLRTRPVLLRVDFVLTKDLKSPYEGPFCGNMRGMGSCSKATKGLWQGRNRPLVKRAVFFVRLKVWGWGLFGRTKHTAKGNAASGNLAQANSHNKKKQHTILDHAQILPPALTFPSKRPHSVPILRKIPPRSDPKFLKKKRRKIPEKKVLGGWKKGFWGLFQYIFRVF